MVNSQTRLKLNPEDHIQRIFIPLNEHEVKKLDEKTTKISIRSQIYLMNSAGYILPLPYQNLGQFYLNKHLNFPPQGYGHTWFKNRPLPLKKKLKKSLT